MFCLSKCKQYVPNASIFLHATFQTVSVSLKWLTPKIKSKIDLFSKHFIQFRISHTFLYKGLSFGQNIANICKNYIEKRYGIMLYGTII